MYNDLLAIRERVAVLECITFEFEVGNETSRKHREATLLERRGGVVKDCLSTTTPSARLRLLSRLFLIASVPPTVGAAGRSPTQHTLSGGFAAPMKPVSKQESHNHDCATDEIVQDSVDRDPHVDKRVLKDH